MTQKLKGITLIESMLVLVVAISIIMLALKLYVPYKLGRDAFLLKYNVDMIFQAMQNYYYANCARLALAPSNNPSNPFPVNISTTLTGYLDPNWRPMHPLIDRAFGSSGYALQFNGVSLSGRRKENFCYYFTNTGQTSPACASLSNDDAIVYLWVAQVVVQVRDTRTTLALKGLTDADCALTNYSASSAADCSAGVTSGNPAYLVWQRLPSFASPRMNSGLGGSGTTVKQFNLQYTNDSLAELVNATYAGSHYYLCGG
ncbi:MAG: hypothetical protein K0S27_639 [Gammaproteobacteria bacterium]|jgi:type II secretory pathway pseudopilin PulG|nr:hypothetical protein [Gammaproteobacteria bacterium]